MYRSFADLEHRHETPRRSCLWTDWQPYGMKLFLAGTVHCVFWFSLNLRHKSCQISPLKQHQPKKEEPKFLNASWFNAQPNKSGRYIWRHSQIRNAYIFAIKQTDVIGLPNHNVKVEWILIEYRLFIFLTKRAIVFIASEKVWRFDKPIIFTPSPSWTISMLYFYP